MSLVCFDTHVVIWGIKQEAVLSQQDMISRAKYLIDKCEEQKKRVLVPSIVVAELLIKIAPAKHQVFIKSMEKKFIVPPFDTQTASHFARIWQKNEGSFKGLVASGEATRQELKADLMILATAVAKKAWCIYSTDPHMKKLAAGFVDVLDLPEVPDVPTQLDLL